jgi:hypothetical protein
MSAESTNRWLILEQDSDRPDWSEAACDGLVWNESGLIRQRPAAGQSPAEAEICVLFLPPVASGWTLPEQFDNRTQWRWNIWCHYGRDITVAETASRWATYERLADGCKRRLSADGTSPPLPFSRSMPMRWSEDFIDLKKSVKSMGSSADAFRHCLGLLRRAWNLARSETDVQARIRAGKEALPVMLAARWVLDALPPAAKENHLCLTRAIRLCRESGLQAMALEKERFSAPVLSAFRGLQFTLLGASQALAKAGEEIAKAPTHDPTATTALRDNLDLTLRYSSDQLRGALAKLINVTQLDAEATTKALELNPRHSRSTA